MTAFLYMTMGSPDLPAANQQWARLKAADMPHLQRWLAHVGAHPVLKATAEALGPKTKEQHMQAIADAGYGGGGEFSSLMLRSHFKTEAFREQHMQAIADVRHGGGDGFSFHISSPCYVSAAYDLN